MAGTSRLAALRRSAGHTQTSFVAAFLAESRRLGITATLTVRTLRRWETEAPPPLPYPGQRAVLEAMLGMPLPEMGFVVPETRRHSAPGPGIGDDEDMRRRTLVAATGGIAAGALLPDLPQAGTWLAAADVGRLRRALGTLYELDHRRGGIPAQARARALEDRITHALNGTVYTAAVGRDLQIMLAEIAAHRAWFAYDAATGGGHGLGGARAAADGAITAACLVDDPLLQIRALASLSLIAVEAGRSWEARSAVERAWSLAETTGAGATIRLVVSLRESNAAVHTGDLLLARRALSRAATLVGRMDRDQEVPRWARYAGQVEVDYATGAWHRRAGRPAQAVPFLRSAVRGLGTASARNTSWYRARLAQALVEAREVEEACAEMHAVLDGCGQVASRRLRGRLAAWARAVGTTGSLAAAEPVSRIQDLLERAV
ncbi:hypothetical protein [Streptomyces sp. NPDC049879]|uniref:hypothetical protein n=1 Tax=Streptomyces sp. NPDC049879 TaxID=3365598 RepID=UPI0037BD9D95